MARLHYVRATAEKAKATCRSHHSDNKWKPGGSSNWYANHTQIGYSMFKQLTISRQKWRGKMAYKDLIHKSATHFLFPKIEPKPLQSRQRTTTPPCPKESIYYCHPRAVSSGYLSAVSISHSPLHLLVGFHIFLRCCQSPLSHLLAMVHHIMLLCVIWSYNIAFL